MPSLPLLKLPALIRYCLLAFGIASVASPLLAQPAPADAAALQQRRDELNKRPDNAGTGPFAAMKEEVASLPSHVVYRPRDLAALGSQKLGVVAWGNGGCSDDGAGSRFHLLELASHGYVVIANGHVYSGPGATRAPAAEPVAQGQPAPPRTESAQLVAALDWALQENQREGSPYYGRIDPQQIALSGYSCGGLQVLDVADDPRVKTLVLHNTGIYNDAAGNISRSTLTKDALTSIHTPLIYILGGETDIAYANGMNDFERISHVPVAAANLAVGHGGTFNQDNGGSAAQVAVAWLQWQLRDDAVAARQFSGPDCVLCRDANWSLQRKGIE